MSNFEDRFYPSTLKKKRILNLKLDVQRFYAIILSLQKNYNEMTLAQFRKAWIDSQMIYLHWCRIPDEDPEQFYQSLYEMFITKFHESDYGKVLCLYSLYFLYFGSEDRIKISVDCKFTDSLTAFISSEKIKANLDICFVTRKLFPEFVFSTRVGLKTILLKGNGEPLKKHHLPSIEAQSYPKLEELVDCQDLKKVANQYEKKKNKRLEQLSGISLKQTDKRLVERIEELMINFRKELN